MSLDLLDKKIEYWEHQLLDLGKRNKMINYKESKRTTLKLIEPSFADFFNKIAINEEKLTFQRSVDKETDVRVFSILSLLENLANPLPVSIGDIKTETSTIERQKTLKNLRSRARLALEEQGINILYLSFGFLEWKDGKGSLEKWIKSPLIIVPAVLSLESLNSSYILSKHDDDIVVNPTLDYYLKTEYGIELPSFEINKNTIEEYLLEIEKIADIRGWKVSREISLGLLSFLKITMYNDLLRNKDRIKDNNVINLTIGNNQETNDKIEEINSFNLDSANPQNSHQVMSADSSQQDAIFYSRNNISFVMQGPPGTGKSQTITNIIAQALADNKKVLFVSEKMAALQVVYKRLEETHLADFCLPLHSYKANKKEILEQIGANLKLKQTKVKDTAIADLQELYSIRTSLNEYAQQLHQLNKELNISCYDVYSKIEELINYPSINFTMENPLDFSQMQLQKMLQDLKKYSLSVEAINYFIKDNPWNGLSARTHSYEYFEKMRAELSLVNTTLIDNIVILNNVFVNSDIDDFLNYNRINELSEIIHQVADFKDIPFSWIENDDLIKLSSIAKDAKKLYSNKNNLKESIDKIFKKEILNYDYINWNITVDRIINELKTMNFTTDDLSSLYFNCIEDFNSNVKIFCEHLNESLNLSNELEDVIGFNYLPNIKSYKHYEFIIKAILEDVLIPSKLYFCDENEVIILLDDAIKNQKIYSDSKNNIEIFSQENKISSENILNIVAKDFDVIDNYKNWNDQTSILVKSIQKLDFIEKEDNDIVINCDKIKYDFESCQSKIQYIMNSFENFNDVLGLNFSINIPNIVNLSNIIELLQKDIIIPKNWFAVSKNEFEQVLDEISQKSKELSQIKSEILEDWENEVFEIDYRNIFLRYKTKYTNIFKFFNKQYKEDILVIKATSRTIIKKLHDDVVIDLLIKLRKYHELNNWFNKNHNRILNVFAFYYDRENTNWNTIKETFDVVNKLSNIIEISNNKKITNIFSKDHKNITEDLNMKFSKVHSYFLEISEILKESGSNIKVSTIRNSFYDNICKHIDSLDVLCNHIHVFNENLKNNSNVKEYFSDNQVDDILKYIIENRNEEFFIHFVYNIDQFSKSTLWFKQKENNMCEFFKDDYIGINSNWIDFKNKVLLAHNISNTFNGNVSDKLVEILECNRTEKTKDLIFKAENNIELLKDDILNSRYKIDIDSNEFNLKNILVNTNEYAIKINELLSCKQQISLYLNKFNTRIQDIYIEFSNIDTYKTIVSSINDKINLYEKIFEIYFSGENTDWENIILLLEELCTIKESSLYRYVKCIFNLDNITREKIKDQTNALILNYYNSQDALCWIEEQFYNDVKFRDLTIKELCYKIKNCLDNIDILGKWIDYQEAKENCNYLSLNEFILKLEESKIFVDIDKVFLKTFYQKWLDAVSNKLTSVRQFRKNTRQDQIEKFVELNSKQLFISQMRIREKLIENLPNENHLLKASDELSILNKELGKRRNIIPLRQLFRRIPNLLMKLKPCLMMSPLSVSYFLEAEAYNFDLVIFDEASQIFPEDAIGAIFRGSQVIITGDSKQLPPTNFFNSTTNNLDNDYDINSEDDYEDVVSGSILEEYSSSLPNRTLLWHYRSKNENLIAFSNKEIYKNKLLTFPNSITNTPDMGVEYIYVEDGYYEGSGKNYNIREARRCVMLVLNHIQKHPERSLGIIAFSEKQQTAIENAIIEFREKMPNYEWFFDESKDEPFFIKNLENVQGDERDTIIFSICYAKDKQGKMQMRFGPLGHAGGERRLNVAITRAKCNIKLVGSILPHDIDLKRTKSDGVRMLRSYIEFARKGSIVLNEKDKNDNLITNDEFCDIIANFLEENGYLIKRNIGCSDYKIDIAIENPDNEGEFVAGIECDGLSYIQARTAGDRDDLRKSVLQNMGWNLYRVWSTEWVRNTEFEKQKIIEFLNSLKDKTGKVTHNFKQSNKTFEKSILENISQEITKDSIKTNVENPYNLQVYNEVKYYELEYWHPNTIDNAIKNILLILEKEQYVRIGNLYKRLKQVHLYSISYENLKVLVDNIIFENMKDQIIIDEDNFVRALPLKTIVAKIPEKYDDPRYVSLIHTQEFVYAIKEILKVSFGLTVDDLSTECAMVFGFNRKGPKIKEKIDKALDYLTQNNMVKIVDKKVQLIGG